MGFCRDSMLQLTIGYNNIFILEGSGGQRRQWGLIEPMVRQRVRIRFSKSGNLKYIGHKDLLRAFEALFRRARLPLAMSGGYHPKIRMSFPSALALGVEGFDEVLELEMNESADPIDSDGLLLDLNRCTVNGLSFLSARMLGEGEKKAKLVASVFEMPIPEEFREETKIQIASFLAQSSVIVEKPNGKSVDARRAVSDIRLNESGVLTMEILVLDGPEAGVKEILLVLGLEKELFRTVFPKRIRCRLFDSRPD